MKTEFIKQYAHTWRVFARLVGDFDPKAWLHTGRRTITPARLSYHILKAVKYYLEDSTTNYFESGKSIDGNWETAREEDLPSQQDILACIQELREKTETWLSEMDFNAANNTFQWAGETKTGVAIFLLRHTLYHLGELSSLLNECRNGDAQDNFVKAL
jgi:hypothetical protein